jgi:hypothetical protein
MQLYNIIFEVMNFIMQLKILKFLTSRGSFTEFILVLCCLFTFEIVCVYV